MADNFALTYLPRGWLNDTTSRAYVSAHGAAVQMTLGLWREGVKCRFASTAPEDALPYIGDARQIERGPEEATADYRLRLRRSFEIHEERTTKDGYRNALEPLGVNPDTVFVWNHYEAGVGEWWSNVYIVIDMTDGPWTLDLWDDGAWDDGGVWDLNGVTGEEITFLRRTIRKWKWAGSFPVAIWIWLSGDVWDTGDTWDSGTWADTGLAVPILLSYTWDQAEVIYDDAPETWDDGSVWEDAFL